MQVAGAIQNATEIISRRVTALGGNYTEALVRIGMREKQFSAEIDQLAAIYAGISPGATGNIAAPEGGRIYILHDIIVDESSDWNFAIDTSCPDGSTDREVYNAGSNYPAKTGAKPVLLDIVLANFGNTLPNSSQPALAWAKKNKLHIASPRVVFAIARKYPTLHKDLEMNCALVVSLEKGKVYADDRGMPEVCFDSNSLYAALYSGFFGRPDYAWFAYVLREVPLAV